MIWKSFWHVESTALLAQLVVAVIAIILASAGLKFNSPLASALIGFAAFLLIYRLRYKRL